MGTTASHLRRSRRHVHDRQAFEKAPPSARRRATVALPRSQLLPEDGEEQRHSVHGWPAAQPGRFGRLRLHQQHRRLAIFRRFDEPQQRSAVVQSHAGRHRQPSGDHCHRVAIDYKSNQIK